ncbi:hypothetical protein HDU97_009532 [Phlyctochytrium planicorne]|nr:hypothetical protein HDU97_009532 [Phlyctochytrium planicorne]
MATKALPSVPNAPRVHPLLYQTILVISTACIALVFLTSAPFPIFLSKFSTFASFKSDSSSPPTSADTLNFKNLVIFGDSYSDTQNVFKMTNGRLPASPPNYKGRSSNGIIWNEYLANYYNASIHMYAYAGAVSNHSLLSPAASKLFFKKVPDFVHQADTYLNDTPVRDILDPETTLYSVFIGGNDYFAAFMTGVEPNPAGVVATILNVLKKVIVESNVRYLSTWTMGDFDSPTSMILANGGDRKAAIGLGEVHNRLLKKGLDELKKTTNVTIFLTELSDLFKTEAPHYNITVTNKPCMVQRPPAAAIICANPQNCLFWDDVHPTTVGHSILSNATKKTIDRQMQIKGKTVKNSGSRLTGFYGYVICLALVVLT